MTVRFGVSPIAWINDDLPELGAGTPLERVLADAHEIGFSGIELGGSFPRDPAILGPLLASHGLDLVGGWYGGHLLDQSTRKEIEALAPHLALLKAMGCGVFIYAETSNAIHGDRSRPLSAAPRLDEARWPPFGAALTEIADHIASEGLAFAYHPHLGTVVERPEDVGQLLRHTGASVGLTVDTGHAVLGGGDAASLILANPSRIAHVHCKDIRAEVAASVTRAGGGFLDGVLAGMFTTPGDGDLDFAAVMRALADIGYGGWIIVEAEQDPALAAPRRYAEIGLRSLEREAATAGLSTGD